MTKFDRILVVIDANEDYSNAPDGMPIELRKALRLVSDKNSTTIKLVSIGYEPYFQRSLRSIAYDYMALRSDYLDELGRKMQALIQILGAQGYSISYEIDWSHPRYDRVLKFAQDFSADLIVQHCQAYTDEEHYHLTQDSWELVRKCKSLLLLVKDKPWGIPAVFTAAVDPMHSHDKPLFLDEKILDITRAVCTLAEGKMHVLHAYAGSARTFAPKEKIEAAHTAVFHELVNSYKFSDEQLHLVDETPVFALEKCSETLNSDVLVMGVVSRSRISEALVGSIAEKVLDYLKTDILIVKPDLAEEGD